MSKFGLHSQFGVVADTLPCVDPWGFVTFQVLRPGSRKMRQRGLERLRGDKVAIEVLTQQIKRDAKKPETKHVNGSGAELLPPEGAGEERAQRADYADAIEAAIDSGRITVLDLIGKDHDLDTAVDLVAGWDAKGEDGVTVVPCTPENIRELLSSDVLVGEGHPHAGEAMGDVLIGHLLEFARSHETARQKYIESAEKNSAGSSAGV